MHAIHALHRGNTTREQEVNSKQNSDARGHPDMNPRAPSRDRVESGIQEHNSYQDNHSSPLGNSQPNRTTIPFAPVQVVKISSVDHVLAISRIL